MDFFPALIRTNHNNFFILRHPAFCSELWFSDEAHQLQLLEGEDDMKEERSLAPERAPFFLFPEQISDLHDALASSEVRPTQPGGCAHDEPFFSRSACVGWEEHADLKRK